MMKWGLAVIMVFTPAIGRTGTVAADPTLHAVAAALGPGQFAWRDASVWRDAPVWRSGGAALEPVSMAVSLALQRMYIYRGDALVGVARISTGRRGLATPAGRYAILQKARWHRSNLYSNAPMPFMQRLTWDGIALHAGHDPGFPASHGCIRLPAAFARDLFAMTTIGSPVAVTPYPDELPIYFEVDVRAIGAADATGMPPSPAMPYDWPAVV